MRKCIEILGSLAGSVTFCKYEFASVFTYTITETLSTQPTITCSCHRHQNDATDVSNISIVNFEQVNIGRTRFRHYTDSWIRIERTERKMK